MSLKIRSSYAILTASVLALMTGCGEGPSDGVEMEPEVTSDVQQVPENFVLPPPPPPEDTSEVQAANMTYFNGYFERVQGGRAYGWVCMRSSGGAPGAVKVWIDYWDGQRWIEVGNGTANQYRADVLPHCRNTGNHGFNIPLITNNYGYYQMRMFGGDAYYLYSETSPYILTGGY